VLDTGHGVARPDNRERDVVEDEHALGRDLSPPHPTPRRLNGTKAGRRNGVQRAYMESRAPKPPPPVSGHTPPAGALNDELSPSAQIEAILEREREAAVGMETPAPVRVELMPPRLLLIEPDRSLANLVSYCLRRQGYQVETVLELTAAREVIACEMPDLLVVDMSGEPSGLGELLEQLRGRYGTDGPPVIAVHDHGSTADAVYALDAGADVALARPYDPDLLFAHVRALLRRFRPGDGGQAAPAAGARARGGRLLAPAPGLPHPGSGLRSERNPA
jgi:CheY-like chemotaxis protein